jgi:hypothetical protein
MCYASAIRRFASLLLAIPLAANATNGADTAFVEMPLSGYELLAKCLSDNTAFCLGYMRGVADAIVATDRGSSPQPSGICFPIGVSTTELKHVVMRALMADVPARHLAASPLVIRAYRAAWPCR